MAGRHKGSRCLTDPRVVVAGGMLVALATWKPGGVLVEARPGLRRLSPKHCCEAAASLQKAWPGGESLGFEQAYAKLVAAGMPDGGYPPL